MVIAASVANAQSTYLTGANLRNAIEGQTLFGSKWAEFYESNGTIQGKASFLGSYTGQWTAYEDRICYDYPGENQDTCSKLTLSGDTITHYTLSGELKKDGVTQRKPGNALNEF